MAGTENVGGNGASTPRNAFFTTEPMAMDAETLKALAEPGKDAGEAGGGEDAEGAQSEQAADPAPDAAAGAVEKEALAAGWVTKDEWVARKGSEKGWRPAEQYMEVRSHVLPVVSRENRELRAQVAEMRAKMEARDRAEAEQKANYERTSLKLELKQARDDQDWDRFDALTEKMLDLKVAEKTAPVAARPAANAIDPEVQRAFVDFAAANPWVKDDPFLGKRLAIEVKNILEADPKMAVDDVLREAREEIVTRYPHKFNGRRTAMAESGGESGTASSGKRSWNDLRGEWKEQYTDKYFKMNPGVTRELLLRNMPPDAFRN